METKTPPPLGKPIMRLNRTMNLFFRQTLLQVKVNMLTQGIWPAEVYNGYAKVNEERKEKGMWFSTGQGYNSFSHRWVKQPTEEDTSLAVAFSYNEYLPFAEMGVGKGTKNEQVNRNKKGNFKVRYTQKWNRREGKSHRPAILMELRHLQTRMRDYIVDYYGGHIEDMMLEYMPNRIDLKDILF